jgi:protein FAM50
MSNPGSGTTTPRFVSQNATVEEVLSSQTVGLVNLNDFRKRRNDALEMKERDAQELAVTGSRSGTTTPSG